jgi:NAD(P)-dependent dehydrogenase (short-subunit alcohol dehydrogenase family)
MQDDKKEEQRMSDFTGKVAIVTGGANGMGEAVATELALGGATVVIADKDTERSPLVESQIREKGGDVHSIITDVREEEQIKSLVDEVISRFGHIDILDNNAAALELTAEDPALVDLSVDILTRTLQGNLVSAFLGCKYVIPHMIENGGGSIINMASVAGMTGDVNLSAYAMSKAGVIQLTRLVAAQYGRQNVRCNAIAPATILTRNVDAYMPDDYRDTYVRNSLTPYLGTPEDVAGLVAFLASERARYMTGHVLPVDGGIISSLPIVADRREQLGMPS